MLFIHFEAARSTSEAFRRKLDEKKATVIVEGEFGNVAIDWQSLMDSPVDGAWHRLCIVDEEIGNMPYHRLKVCFTRAGSLRAPVCDYKPVLYNVVRFEESI